MSDIHGILVAPLLTEKNTVLAEGNNQFAFRVDMSANKLQIKEAVEKLLKTKVESVRTSVVRGKKRRIGRSTGRRPNWKKAIVTLKEGQTIEPFEGV